MVKFHLIIFFILLLMLIVIGGGCSKEESAGEQYVIEVDSIIHADTINIGEVLAINYYGMIGTTDCNSFGHFDVSFNNNQIQTTVYGLYKEKDDEDDECEDDTTYLDGEEVRIYELKEGEFTIVVSLPRNRFLESKVYIVPDR